MLALVGSVDYPCWRWLDQCVNRVGVGWISGLPLLALVGSVGYPCWRWLDQCVTPVGIGWSLFSPD